MVADLAEVLLAKPIESGAVELRGAADVVVHLWLEGLAARVIPGVRRYVAVLDENVRRVPILRLAREPIAALEQEDALARGSQVAREGAAARAGADDDDVEVAHEISATRSVRIMRAPASISARWEKAWGKLP